MARLWKALVLVMALAVVPCEAHRPPRFEDIVDRAIEAYNNGRPGKPLFRLVDATQPSGQVSVCHPAWKSGSVEGFSYLGTGHVAQLVECLSCIRGTLDLNPSTLQVEATGSEV